MSKRQQARARARMRTALIWWAALLFAAAASARSLAWQDVVANDPIDIGGGAAPMSADDESSPPGDDASEANQAVGSTAPLQTPAITLPPVNLPDSKARFGIPSAPAISASKDARPLGPPRESRAIPPVTPSAPTAASFWQKLDPRRHEITRVLGALAVVIGLLLLLRVLLRRAGILFGGSMGPWGGSRPSGVVEILARYPIARGQQLLLLKLARRIVLLHHAGSTMRPLTELTQPDEVAALLSRMESGSTGRDSLRFQAVLREFEAEHNTLASLPGAGIRRALPAMEAEVVDLTRQQQRGISAFLTRKAAS